MTSPDILAPPLEPRDRILVVGKTGTGKSHLVKTRLLSAHPRVVALDQKGEYVVGGSDAPPGMRALRAVSVDEFVELMTGADPADHGELAVAVQCFGRTWEQRADNVRTVIDTLADCRDLLVIVDEVALLPRESWQDLEYLACLSRSWGQPVVMVAQRATQIPKTAREQATRVVSFRQNALNDAAALVDLCGPDAERITSLPRFQYFYWHETHADLPYAAPAETHRQPTLEQTTARAAPSKTLTRRKAKRTAARKPKSP